MRNRRFWLLSLLFSFSNLSAQQITEYYPVAFAPERDWPAARDQIAILSRQDPNRPIIVMGFQEALELSFMGLPVVFVHHNQNLIRSFEKMLELAKKAPDAESFFAQIPQIFTEQPLIENEAPVVHRFSRSNGEILAEMHDFSPPAVYSSPEDLSRILRAHGNSGFQNFQTGSGNSSFRSLLIDLGQRNAGDQIKAELGVDRAAIVYSGAYVRDRSFLNQDGNSRATQFQTNIAQLIAHTQEDGIFRRRISIVSAGVHGSTRLSAGTPNIVFESEDSVELFVLKASRRHCHTISKS